MIKEELTWLVESIWTLLSDVFYTSEPIDTFWDEDEDGLF